MQKFQRPDLQFLPARFAAKSHSSREPVFALDDALEAIDIYKMEGIRELGWEGWISYPDGKIGHSRGYQGTAGLFEIDSCRKLILEAQRCWDSVPEVKGAVLLFCLTPGSAH